MIKKIIDISWPITLNVTEYKNRKTVRFLETKKFQQDHARENILNMHAHTGTHIDAPAHFLENGKKVGELSLEKLINIDATILDLTHCAQAITKNDLEKYAEHIKENCFILLKTKNSFLSFNAPFNPEFVYLNSEAAAYLVSKKIAGVGIDYLGIERNQPGHPTHKMLLSHDIIIIEGLRLGHVDAGNYLFTCLPLLLSDLEAAPARATIQTKGEIR